MTLILKSDLKMRQQKLTDIVGGAVLNLDFRDEEYYKKGVKSTSVLDFINSVSSYGGYYNTAGVYTEAPANTVKIASDNVSNRKGLLSEGTFENLYPYGSAPISHSMSKTTSVIKVTRVIASGAGYVDVTYNGVNLGKASEGKPVQLPSDGTIGGLLVFTVVGNVTYLALIDSDLAQPYYSKVNRGIRPSDMVSIKDSLVQELLPTGEGTVVTRMFIPKDVVKPTRHAKTFALLTLVNATNDGYYASSYSTSPYDSSLYRRSNGVATSLEHANVGMGTDVVVALSFTASGIVSLYMNGQLVSKTNQSATTPTKIMLGSSPLWNLTGVTFTEEAAIYDRVFTDSEMELISSLV